MRRALVVVAGLAASAVLAGCGGNHTDQLQALTKGILQISPGECTSKTSEPTGSYLVVISAATGKLVTNKNGGCKDPSYTPLRAGADGGLELGTFQEGPSPTFGAGGNSRDNSIIAPVNFRGHELGFSTNPRDEQDAPTSPPAFPAPRATVQGTTIHVDLRSLVLSYRGVPHTNCAQTEGSGCWELGSLSASGTYDPSDHEFTLKWFTGESFTPQGDSVEIQLTGRFVADGIDATASTASDEVRALSQASGLVEALPAAFRQVPSAGISLSRGKLTRTALLRVMDGSKPLADLATAVRNPKTFAAPIIAAFKQAADGDPVTESQSTLATQVQSLTAAESEILPALRAAAATVGVHPSAGAAQTSLESNRRTSALATVEADWSQLYGDLQLVEAAADSATS